MQIVNILEYQWPYLSTNSNTNLTAIGRLSNSLSIIAEKWKRKQTKTLLPKNGKGPETSFHG